MVKRHEWPELEPPSTNGHETRRPLIGECAVNVRVVDVTPGIFLRTWTALRKLIRRRQESQAIRDARLEAVKSKRDAAKQVADIALKLTAKDNQIKELEGRLATKAREVSRLEDTDIPRLKNRIDVLEDENKLLAALHEKNLTREKAEIAVYNERIVGAKDPAVNWQQRMMGE
jgi:predicted nuclease with TOPRIM domain